MDRGQLHSLAARFTREFTEDALSGPQEWLWGAVLSELEYRHRATPKVLDRCWCCYCRPLDQWSEVEADVR